MQMNEEEKSLAKDLTVDAITVESSSLKDSAAVTFRKCLKLNSSINNTLNKINRFFN